MYHVACVTQVNAQSEEPLLQKHMCRMASAAGSGIGGCARSRSSSTCLRHSSWRLPGLQQAKTFWRDLRRWMHIRPLEAVGMQPYDCQEAAATDYVPMSFHSPSAPVLCLPQVPPPPPRQSEYSCWVPSATPTPPPHTPPAFHTVHLRSIDDKYDNLQERQTMRNT